MNPRQQLPAHYHFRDQNLEAHPQSYRTPEGYTKLSPFKARRGPFYWRKLTEEDLRKFVQLEPLPFGIFSWEPQKSRELGPERIEAYCGGEDCAKWLCDKWNEEAALIIITDGTAASELIDI